MKKLLFSFILTAMAAITLAQTVERGEGRFFFLENKGQWPEFVHYRASTPAGKIYLEDHRILYQFQDFSGLHDAHFGHKSDHPLIKEEIITARFKGSKKIKNTAHDGISSNYYNFFIGNDPDKWASNVYGFNEVTLYELYNRIDLRVYDQDFELKYDYILHPGSNPESIRVEYTNHSKIKLDRDGNLIIKGELGEIKEKKPYAYQIKNGKILEVPCKFVLEENTVSFQVGEYDKDLKLVIDPQLIFATYSGSFSNNFGMTATYDDEGNAFSAGTAFGNQYPTTNGAYDEDGTIGQNAGNYGITDIVITKYSADGTSQIYSTYVGGGTNTWGTETPHSLICDTTGNLYFMGVSSSWDFPTFATSYDNSINGGDFVGFVGNGTYFYDSSSTTGGTDIIVGKLSPGGNILLGSTFVGGSENDGLTYNQNGLDVNGNYSSPYDSLTFNYGDEMRGEIMLDSAGYCYIASSTRSSDFPVASGFQNTFGGEQDGVVFKLDPDLTNLEWSSYIGGSTKDGAYNLKVNATGEVYVTGGTMSNDFTTTVNAYQTSFQGEVDGFVARISNDGSTLLNSTLIGTPLYDQSYFLQIDRVGDIFITGQTLGTFPLTSNVYSNNNGSQFITKLNPDLSTLLVSTMFGNSNGQVNISPSAFLVDQCGNIYVSGWGGGINGSLHQAAPLSGMPITNDAFQSTSPNGRDFYLIVLSSEAQSLVYGSYIGGSASNEHVDGGTSRFDKKGVVYQSVCGGCFFNSDFPTTPSNVWSSVNNNSCNNLVFKFQFDIIPNAEFETDILEGCAPLTIQFDNFSSAGDTYQWDFGDGVVIDSVFNPTYTFTDSGAYEVLLTVTDSACNITDSALKVIQVYPELMLDVSNDTVICDPNPIDLTANSYGTVDDFLWSSDTTFSDTLNNYPNDSTISVNPVVSTWYYIKVSNPYCDLIDSVFINFTADALNISADTLLCKGDTIDLNVSSADTSITFSVEWEPEEDIVGSSTGNGVSVNPDDSTYFVFTATSSNGCVIIDSIFVAVTEIPDSIISASAAPSIVAEGGTTILTAQPSGYSYTWFPPVGLDDPTAQSTEAIINEDVIFTVSFSDGKCTNTDTTFVEAAEFECVDPYIYVPNAFTPNGDGVNEVVRVLGPNIVKLNFVIYDRWGEKVFETQDQSEVWDGTFKGMNCDPDVYVYYLETTCVGDLENFQKGNITLIR